MASNEWLVRKLHEQDKKIEALSRGGTGVGHTSIAPGENLTVISDNGEVVLGAGGVEHVDGPTPATPSAPTLKLGFGTIETTWDGSFAEGEDEDGVPLTAPVDFDVVEVHCSTDPEEEEWGEDTMRGQIKTREGGTITVGGFDVDDEVFVCLIALAKTGKRSAPSATASLVIEGLDFSQLFTEIDAANATIKNAGEVLVSEQDTLNDKLSDAFGQIEDAVASANGKNVVHYEDRAPTVDDAGTDGDTWFVGQVGRNEELLATNLALNPSFTTLNNQLYDGEMSPSAGTAAIVSAEWAESGGTALKLTPTSSNNTTAVDGILRDDPRTAEHAGRTFTVSANIHLEEAQTGSLWSGARRITVRTTGGSQASYTYAVSETAPNAPGTYRVSVTFTLPSDISSWYFLLGNGSATTPVYWDSIMIEEGSGSGQYFDGDTPDGETDNDPHYRWTGEPHASTSEKYLPATEGLSSNWNVTAQYRFINGAWESVELSHTVLSSLDLGKLVAGSAAIKEAVVQKLWAEVVVTKMAVAEQFIGENAILTGAVTAPKITASEELWAKIAQFVKIRAEHIEADAIDGMVVTGATIRTSGGSGEWSDAGLRINAPDGTNLVRFPTDGTPLSLTASDTNIDRASVGELDVTDGAVRSGGTFALASGVTPPASPPGLELGWEEVASFTQPSPGYSFDWVGLANWGTKWVRAVNVLGSAGDTLDAFEVYSASGSFEKKISLDINPRAGVTVIGDVAYTLGTVPGDANRQWVHGFNLNTGVRVTRWEFTRFGSASQQKLAIGNDGTNIVVAGVHAQNPWLYLIKYTPATGAQIGVDMRDTNYDVAYTKEIQGVYVTGSIAYVAHQKDTRRYSISGDTLTRTDNGWRNPETSAAGLVLASTPHLVSTSGVLYRGSLFADSTLEACYTWWDGVRETTPSPVAALGMQAARVVSVSVGRRAGLQKRFYYRVGSGNWERTTLGEDETATTIYAPTTLNPKYPLPTVNTFPNADPALLTSTNEKFQVFGDGSGKWGPLTFNADGTMTSAAIPSWVPVTTFLSGATPYGGSANVPAYRVWPDGKVEWRGVVSVAAGTATTPFLTIPVDARPPYWVPFVVPANGSANGYARVDVADPSTPTTMRVVAGGGSVAWVGLSGIYYYKS